MTFTDIKSLERYILKCNESAILVAQEKVYRVIKKFLDQYYAEYFPHEYIRTEQLLRSLVKSEVIKTPTGYIAQIYFDASSMEYKGWSGERVLHEAMVGGTHGGYVAPKNTKIWEESLSVLKTETYPMLKKALIDAGIPIK